MVDWLVVSVAEGAAGREPFCLAGSFNKISTKADKEKIVELLIVGALGKEK